MSESAKLFVGGLNWETTTEELQRYFEQFGRVTEVTLKNDRSTGLPRGFGFVAFADPASVDMVLATGCHVLHGKNIDPKRLKLRPELGTLQKIFVGGLDPLMSEESIRDYFGQFGMVDELDWPCDRATNERRKFCFVRFTSNDPIEWLCARPRHTISGKQVEVKKAVAKDEISTKSSIPTNISGSAVCHPDPSYGAVAMDPYGYSYPSPYAPMMTATVTEYTAYGGFRQGNPQVAASRGRGNPVATQSQRYQPYSR